jgi:hypothetical protein
MAASWFGSSGFVRAFPVIVEPANTAAPKYVLCANLMATLPTRSFVTNFLYLVNTSSADLMGMSGGIGNGCWRIIARCTDGPAVADGCKDGDGPGVADGEDIGGPDGNGSKDVDGTGVADGSKDVDGTGVADGSKDVDGTGVADGSKDGNGPGVADGSKDGDGPGVADSEDIGRLDGNGSKDVDGTGVAKVPCCKGILLRICWAWDADHCETSVCV